MMKNKIDYPENCNEDTGCDVCVYVEEDLGCKLDKEVIDNGK
jgi:hypothetical protein